MDDCEWSDGLPDAAAVPLVFDPVDPRSTLPLFLQVVDRFEAALRTGRLRAGQSVPPESELCAQLGVSRKTLRHATDHLSRIGLIRRRQGIGTVVTEEARVDGLSARRSMHAELVGARRTPETRLLSQQRVAVDAGLSRETGFHVGCELLYLRRLRLADGDVLAVLENLVPTVYMQELRPSELEGSFLELVHRRSFHSSLIRQEIAAIMPSASQAGELGIPTTAPILRERISSFNETGEIFHRSVTFYHPENYRMTAVTLSERTGGAAADQPRSAAAGD